MRVCVFVSRRIDRGCVDYRERGSEGGSALLLIGGRGGRGEEEEGEREIEEGAPLLLRLTNQSHPVDNTPVTTTQRTATDFV